MLDHVTHTLLATSWAVARVGRGSLL